MVSLSLSKLVKPYSLLTIVNFFFNTHKNVIFENLGKQSGLVSKLRHCLPGSQLILFYKTNIQPTIQYGVLIYGCWSYTSLLTIVKLQRKIVGLFALKKNFSSVEDDLMMYGSLSVYELYLYELLKFVLKSIINLHSEKYLNNLFVFSNSSRNTRSCCKNFLQNNARLVMIQLYSIFQGV